MTKIPEIPNLSKISAAHEDEMSHERNIIIRRLNQQWSVSTDEGATSVGSRLEAIEAALRLASENSNGEPIKIEITRSVDESPVSFFSVRGK